MLFRSISVKLVQMYSRETRKNLLNNIFTVANLVAGAYGLYNSKYNKKVITKTVQDKIRFKFGDDVFKNNKINTIPEIVLKKYIPELLDQDIQPSDVIYVNVSRILKEFGDTPEAILEIASTIVHEATHEKEREEKGSTSEAGPIAEEKKFLNWIKLNKNRIKSMFPQIQGMK